MVPCYDGGRENYNDSEVRELRARCDLLARVACRALTELEQNDIADMLLLRDDETRDFWAKHKEFDAKRKAQAAEKRRRTRLKRAALSKLSPEEQEALGVVSQPSGDARGLKVQEMIKELKKSFDDQAKP